MHRQDLPKQFLPLGEKPIIINTLEQFYLNLNIDKIIVVAPEAWKLFTADLINKHDAMGKDIAVITGGENKTVSVQMMVKHIESSWGVGDDDIIIIHDAVRPFITQRVIDENIAAAKQYGAASTVITTGDTIIVSDNGSTISEIPYKRKMFAEQTPLTFNLKTLETVFLKAIEQGISLNMETELARLYITQGNEMRLVQGEYSNMKIITPYDLKIANALLVERKS